MDSRLKVAYIVSRFPHRYQTFVRREITELVAQNVDVTVFPVVGATAPSEGSDADCAVPATVKHNPLFSTDLIRNNVLCLRENHDLYLNLLFSIIGATWLNPVNMVKSVFAFHKGMCIACEIKAGGFNHIHAHWATHPATAAMTASAFTGIPFSFAFHAYDIFATRIMIPEKITKAAFVVVNCQYTMDYIRNLYPQVDRQKLALVYNGIAPEKFTASTPAAVPPLILAVGQLVPTKGFDYFIEACRLLNESGHRFEAMIIGDGPLMASLRERVETCGLRTVLTLAGEKTQDEIMTRLAEATVLVMPCITPERGTHDALPNVVIEAQAAGLPVVASGVFGIPELVEHDRTGLLVPERDSAALKRALAALLADPARARALGNAGRQKALQMFDVRQNVRQIHNLIEKTARVATDKSL